MGLGQLDSAAWNDLNGLSNHIVFTVLQRRLHVNVESFPFWPLQAEKEQLWIKQILPYIFYKIKVDNTYESDKTFDISLILGATEAF